MFPDKIKDGIPAAETGEHDRLPTQLGRQPQGFGDLLLIFEGGVIVRGFDVDREPLDPGGFGQAAGGPHQLPGGGTGIEANDTSHRPPGAAHPAGGAAVLRHRQTAGYPSVGDGLHLSRLRLTLGIFGLDGLAAAPETGRYLEA